MNLTPADKALAAGFAGDPQHYELEPRYFDVTGTDDSGLKREMCIPAEDGCSAVNAGLDLGWAGVVAHPHPRELTEADGRARFASGKALRVDAFTDAWRGYMAAEEEARAARLARGQRDDWDDVVRGYDHVLVAQMTTPAMNEFDRYHQRGAV